MAKVVAIGQPVNDAERLAIAYLRDHLPDAYSILHNFEIKQGPEIFEIDLAILAPHGVYVIDVKGTHGLVDIYGSKWYPDGRQPYHSPLAKLRQHAKVLRSLVCDAHPEKLELTRVNFNAAVLMTAPDASVVDHDGRDGDNVTYLKKCIAYIQDTTRIPSQRLLDIRPYLSVIEQSIRGKARPKSGPVRFRDWKVDERLGGDDHYTEYRAKHVLLGAKGISARLRVYRADPYLDRAARETEQKRISNAYLAVAHMPSHPNILGAREFFPTENEDAFVLVTEDIAGMALRQHLRKAGLALTFDQKTRVMHDVLKALAHAHTHNVIHRNLTPDAILVGADGTIRLTGFDYARVGPNRTSTIAPDIVDDVDPAYQAPECYRDPSQASSASDLFSAGLIFYELLTGECAFDTPEAMFDQSAVFPVLPTDAKRGLPPAFNEWLQHLCTFVSSERPADAQTALEELERIVSPPAENSGAPAPQSTPAQRRSLESLSDLSKDTVIADRFVIQERLGKPGGFAVAYRVFDTYGDVVRVLKLVTRDRRSVFERVRQEYRVLTLLPEHPHVVRAIWADRLPDETPYIIFEYVNGLDVEELLHSGRLSLDDALTIAHQVALGLGHLHRHGVYHQDIKPSNLLWTDDGVRILDFNVASSDRDEVTVAGGTRRYVPPDYDTSRESTTQEKIDRDLYALGVTLYECVTGTYPFRDADPRMRGLAKDPRELAGCEDLNPQLADLMLRSIVPARQDRFASADSFLDALHALPPQLRLVSALAPTAELRHVSTDSFSAPRPNYNPFVSYLQTLYSQSQRTNAGTRGLDAASERTYVSTLLDTQLQPAILAGDFRLVVISGNAGDGKTAFIQRLEHMTEAGGVPVERYQNGSRFAIDGRIFQTNYDGSQDEGERVNDDVLLEFLAPFAGDDPDLWPQENTRLIAINEGRLVDFLTEHQHRFPRLRRIARAGLTGADAEDGIAVINLNLRAVVQPADGTRQAIFDRLLAAFTDQRFWAACGQCDLRDRCYIHHNTLTFSDPVAGPKAAERLRMLHTITHLRGRLHITLRDLRSALALMLVGTRDCDDVHALYRTGTPDTLSQILNGYYFNAWIGGREGSEDRLLKLLRDIDVGEASNPEQDRILDFLAPDARQLSRFGFEGRGRYDDELLTKVFNELPREFGERSAGERLHLHRDYVAMLRRRDYFERRDDEWRRMLPYRSTDEFLNLVRGLVDSGPATQKLVWAINRGEGLTNPATLGSVLALRVRQVERGTVRGYRLFDGASFAIVGREDGRSPFVEHLPQYILLRYTSALGNRAELPINLDMFEMLTKLNDGYRPNVEEMQGFYLSLAVFKNILASAPYQEVLLTETGHDFYRIRRHDDGVLSLTSVAGKVEDEH